jgi:hypothetical protein
MRIINFNHFENFIPKVLELKEHGIKVLGYFPYETARVGETDTQVSVPRSVFSDIERILHREGIVNDNKIVVIFETIERFETENFALQLKDCYARMGRWNTVLQYDGHELKLKKEYENI